MSNSIPFTRSSDAANPYVGYSRAIREISIPMAQSLSDISKFLSYVLRHKPDAIGVELDPEGWANIGDLIAKADVPLTRGLLLEILDTCDKKRFAISADGAFIRANQGHSVVVDLGLDPVEPPALLYHGTATRFLTASGKKDCFRRTGNMSTSPLTGKQRRRLEKGMGNPSFW